MSDLKSRTLRGGAAKSVAQAANFLLRTACLIGFARLLGPTDFGLVGMVTAITGFLSLFREFGLSVVTVQRSEISDRETSALFWINIAVGVLLFAISLAIAPVVASFYGDPRLNPVMMVLGSSFLFNSIGVQHSALLQRQLRFTTLAVIDVIALLVSSLISLVMAFRGFGYWALVAWSVALPLATSIQCWYASGWKPGRPSWHVGTGSMLRFGSIVTLNMIVIHFAYNIDKVLLGRFRGAEAVGIYGRAYQLITLPIEQVNSTIGSVAISVLSRLQDDRIRMLAYFRKGYAVTLAVTVPVAIICAILAEQIVLILFGPKWRDAIGVFRLLAPTVLVFAIINPPGWLLVAQGRIERSLKIALAIAALVIAGCVVGLPYGAKGVATGFSAAMTLWLVPHLLWCFHGTGISVRDVVGAVGRPLLAGAIAGAGSLATLHWIPATSAPIASALAGGSIFGVIYLCILLLVMKQGDFYLDIIRALRGSGVKKSDVLT